MHGKFLCQYGGKIADEFAEMPFVVFPETNRTLIYGLAYLFCGLFMRCEGLRVVTAMI
jgi:hypothetical protein